MALGQDYVPVVYKSCVSCKNICYKKVVRCKLCKSGCYCSKVCRRNHKSEHAELCDMIQQLEALELQKRVFTVRETGQVKSKNRLVRLVGEKPLLQCKLNGVDCSALWDTGSMVSTVSSCCFRNLFLV